MRTGRFGNAGRWLFVVLLLCAFAGVAEAQGYIAAVSAAGSDGLANGNTITDGGAGETEAAAQYLFAFNDPYGGRFVGSAEASCAIAPDGFWAPEFRVKTVVTEPNGYGQCRASANFSDRLLIDPGDQTASFPVTVTLVIAGTFNATTVGTSSYADLGLGGAATVFHQLPDGGTTLTRTLMVSPTTGPFDVGVGAYLQLRIRDGDGDFSAVMTVDVPEGANYTTASGFGPPAPSFQLPFFETGDLFAGQISRIDVGDITTPQLVGSCLLLHAGLAFDAEGNLYAANNGGLRIFDRNFQEIGFAQVTDPESTDVRTPIIRKSGQVLALDAVGGDRARLWVFDTSDLTAPVLARLENIPIPNVGSTSLAIDAEGTVWVATSRSVTKLTLDDDGRVLGADLVHTVANGHITFQPSTGLMFQTHVNTSEVNIIAADDPATVLATITDICDGTTHSPQTTAFDSKGNLFISCANAGGDETDLVTIPAASLVNLSGSLTAASLGATRSNLLPSGGYFLAFKPKSTSRDPFTIDAGSNISILSQDQAATRLTGTITTNPLNESFRGGWLLNGEFVAGPGALPNPFSLALSNVDPLPVGDHVFTYEVGGCMLTVRDTVIVTVENSAPTAAPSGAGTFDLGDFFDVGGQVLDYDGDTLAYEWRLGTTVLADGTVATTLGGDPVALPVESIATSALGAGVHTLELAVDDGVNDEVTATIVVEIVQNDVIAPTCDPEPSTTMLWPPSHEMVDVAIAVNAADDSGGPVTIGVTVTVSDAETNGDNTEPDFVILDDGNADGVIDLQLRAERAGKGDGRTYTVTITVTDEAGNQSMCDIAIVAPHSKGKNQ